MTMQALLLWGGETLKHAGISDWELDARYLLLEAFQISLSSYLAVRKEDLDSEKDAAEKCSCYKELIQKRASRIPLQHLTGVQEFMGQEFFVNEYVLIPRQDTETLVELVLEEQKEQEISLLDMCTGSGCIAICLALMGSYRRVAALDISPEALKVAGQNADRLLGDERERLELIESNLFEALGKEEQFDVLVSNPPYIPTDVIEKLEPEVREFEPRLALDGTEDGLYFYRQLAKEGWRVLKPGASVYLEIGHDQAEDVRAIFASKGYKGICVKKDLAGHDRVLKAIRPCVVNQEGQEGKYV